MVFFATLLPLRVCPETSRGIAEFSEHEADGGEAQEGERLSVEAFPIFGEPATPPEPCKGALDDPSFGEDDEARGLIRSLDDFNVDVLENARDGAAELWTLITAVSVEFQKERIKAEQGRHEKFAAVSILNVGGMHDRVHQEALRIDENMPLLALDLLSGIITRRVVKPPFSALFTL